MQSLRGLLALGLLGLALLAPAASADVAIPALRARVTDLSASLSAEQSAALEQKLAAFEREKGSQIAVLILPGTQPETIEQYGIRLAEAWKLGRKGVDDGAILIVAKDEHRLRIEVGYGLEGALNDATCNRIISEAIVPLFKQGRFYEGIDAGVDRMIGVVNGEPLPPPPPRRNTASGDGDNPFGLLIPVFIGFFVVGHVLRWIFGSGPASAVVGIGTGIVAMLLTGSALVAIGSGVLGVFVALILYAARGMGGIGGWGGGGLGGGGFGGGGGFSGGGGGFGGGGSSGSW